MASEKIIGIDLGTSHSVIAVIEDGDPKVIDTLEGSRLMPSVVAFTQDGERLVGQAAKQQAAMNPEHTIFSIQRLMGRRFDEVIETMNTVPYSIVRGPHDDTRIDIRGKRYAPPEISAMILQRLRDAAEQDLGQKITKAVITIPSDWYENQRQATKDAGRIAGLEVLQTVPGPTAAGLGYGLDRKKDETIVVYDFGGGTFNISILEVGEGVVEVKSTRGDNTLGGDDLDRRILGWIVAKCKQGLDIDFHRNFTDDSQVIQWLREAAMNAKGDELDQRILELMVAEKKKELGIKLGMTVSRVSPNDSQTLQRLREAAEDAKKDLSSLTKTDINIPLITGSQSGPKHLNITLTREKFEELIDDLLERTLELCRGALKDAGLAPADIDEVVLVGGSTRIPKVQELVKTLFGKEPHKGLNPDEAGAVGAAILAGTRGGDVKDLLLNDVTPFSLRIKIAGGVTATLIERNTTIPTRKSETFTTEVDNQTSFEVHILQGEHEMARDNRSLGKFYLEGIPPAPRGIPQIEVTIDIDVNMNINVSAKDLGTGKDQQITLTASSGLSEDEIDRMIKDAEMHSEEDKKRREAVDVKNQADSLMYQTEKLLNENRDKISVDDISVIEDAIKQTKEAIESNDFTQMRTAIDNLTKASHRIAEVMYQQQTQQQADTQPEANAQPGSEKKDEDVVDAEFEDVN